MQVKELKMVTGQMLNYGQNLLMENYHIMLMIPVTLHLALILRKNLIKAALDRLSVVLQRLRPIQKESQILDTQKTAV